MNNLNFEKEMKELDRDLKKWEDKLLQMSKALKQFREEVKMFNTIAKEDKKEE